MPLYAQQKIAKIKGQIKSLEESKARRDKETKEKIQSFILEMQGLEEKNLEDGIDCFFVKCCQIFSPNGVIRLAELSKMKNINTGEYEIIVSGAYVDKIRDFKLNNLTLEKIFNIVSSTSETLIVYKDGKVELSTTKSVFADDDEE